MSDADKYKFYLEQVKDMTLEVLHDDAFCKAFLLRKYPDRIMMSTIILFTCDQIIITGDLRVNGHGLMSDFGYGLDWFSDKKDSSYLAEKFLERQWVMEYALEYWQD